MLEKAIRVRGFLEVTFLSIRVKAFLEITWVRGFLEITWGHSEVSRVNGLLEFTCGMHALRIAYMIYILHTLASKIGSRH